MAVRRSGIPISVDLTDSAVHLWEFLKLIDNYPWLYEGLHVHNAVRRYEVYWLPLVAKVDPRYPLAAPLDIEWVWYVHMLSPYAYNRDCLHRFGQVLDHRITSAKDRNIGLNNAREIWERAYTKEEFSLDLTAPPKITDTFTSKFSYDLFAGHIPPKVFQLPGCPKSLSRLDIPGESDEALQGFPARKTSRAEFALKRMLRCSTPLARASRAPNHVPRRYSKDLRRDVRSLRYRRRGRYCTLEWLAGTGKEHPCSEVHTRGYVPWREYHLHS